MQLLRIDSAPRHVRSGWLLTWLLALVCGFAPALYAQAPAQPSNAKGTPTTPPSARDTSAAPKAAKAAATRAPAAKAPAAKRDVSPAAKRPIKLRGAARLKPPKRRVLPMSKAGCIKLFRARQYRTAGECFEKIGMGYGPGKKLPPLRRYAKGQMLRNAAVAFEKEALLSSRVEVAAWLRQRAVSLLQIYRNETLCESTYRCRIALDLETRIAKKIGQLQLTVVTNHSNALLVVKGYRFKASFQKRASITVRPGPYTIEVKYPDEKKARKKLVTLQPGTSHIETFFPKIKQRSISKVSIGLYIAASVLIAGGGALTGVGAAQWYLAEQEWDDPTTKRSQKPGLEAQREGAQPMIWSGAGSAGVGVVLLIIGFAFHTPPPPPKAVTAPPPKAKKLGGAAFDGALQLVARD